MIAHVSCSKVRVIQENHQWSIGLLSFIVSQSNHASIKMLIYHIMIAHISCSKVRVIQENHQWSIGLLSFIVSQSKWKKVIGSKTRYLIKSIYSLSVFVRIIPTMTIYLYMKRYASYISKLA